VPRITVDQLVDLAEFQVRSSQRVTWCPGFFRGRLPWPAGDEVAGRRRLDVMLATGPVVGDGPAIKWRVDDATGAAQAACDAVQ